MKIRTVGIGIAVLCSLLIGRKGYFYFFDLTTPQLSLHGLEHHGYYGGDINATIVTTKNGTISLSLDGQSLVSHCYLRADDAGHPFTIPSRTLQNGNHILKAEFTDNSYQKNKTTLECPFMVDNTPLQVAFIKTQEAKVFQGRTLHVQFQANKKIDNAQITALSQQYHCFPESKNALVYECFIPIPCEEMPNEYLLSLDVTDPVGNKTHLDSKFQVVMFPFKKISLTVDAEKIKEEEKLGLDTKMFEQEIEKLTAQSPKEKCWKGPFCTPIDIQRVTSEFGTIRTTQHKGRYAHKALDVINQPKSVVWAPQDGIVVMKDRYAASGNTVIIDHGHGILSMFFHLDTFSNIAVGEKIAKGNPVGTIGKTGYAQGYHLHWEMRVNNVAIDPMQWTKVIF